MCTCICNLSNKALQLVQVGRSVLVIYLQFSFFFHSIKVKSDYFLFFLSNLFQRQMNDIELKLLYNSSLLPSKEESLVMKYSTHKAIQSKTSFSGDL